MRFRAFIKFLCLLVLAGCVEAYPGKNQWRQISLNGFMFAETSPHPREIHLTPDTISPVLTGSVFRTFSDQNRACFLWDAEFPNAFVIKFNGVSLPQHPKGAPLDVVCIPRQSTSPVNIQVSTSVEQFFRIVFREYQSLSNPRPYRSLRYGYVNGLCGKEDADCGIRRTLPRILAWKENRALIKTAKVVLAVVGPIALIVWYFGAKATLGFFLHVAFGLVSLFFPSRRKNSLFKEIQSPDGIGSRTGAAFKSRAENWFRRKQDIDDLKAAMGAARTKEKELKEKVDQFEKEDLERDEALADYQQAMADLKKAKAKLDAKELRRRSKD